MFDFAEEISWNGSWRAARVAFAALGLGLALSACSSIDGAPSRAVDLDTELESLRAGFGPATIAAYNAAVDNPTERRTWRDEIINSRISFADLSFNAFRRAIRREGISTNVGRDMITIGLGAAGALSTGGMSQILSAVSGGVVGATESINRNMFFDQTMPALINAMEASRKVVLARLVLGMDQPDAQYSLSAARIELENYFQAGTLDGAISSIEQASGERAARAEEILVARRSSEFFSEPLQDRVDVLLDQIGNLSDAQALALVANLPTTTPEIERTMAFRDSSNQRFTNPAVARQMLSMGAVLIERDDADTLKAWEDEITAALAAGQP